MASTISEEMNTITNSLKRKRPPKLEIPKVLQEIGKAGNGAQNVSMCYRGNGFCVSSVKGKKKFMEDTYKVMSCLHGPDNVKGFFGVYDGHGGRKAADFVAENLHTNILEMLKKSAGDCSKEEAVKAAYVKTDKEFLKEGLESGACCVTALIEGTDLVVSYLGDCRAVLSRSGIAEALSKDHKAEREDEKKRIEDMGGFVINHRGAWRVHGVLSVSRSIGDAHLKDWVLAEPDTQVLHLTPDMDFLVLASDGLWSEVGNQEAVDTVTRFYAEKKPGLTSGLKIDYEDDDYGRVNASPPSKIRRISLAKQQKAIIHSPSKKKTLDQVKGGLWEFNCENRSPPLNTPRISLAKGVKVNPESPAQEDSSYSQGSCPVGMLAASKEHSLVKQQKAMTHSPSNKRRVDNIKDSSLNFNCENESPQVNTPRISLVKRLIAKPKPSNQEDTSSQGSNPEGILAACKELVKLAVSRGCLDDITVIVVDLNHFKCKS